MPNLLIEVSSSFVPHEWQLYKRLPTDEAFVVEQPDETGKGERIVFMAGADRGITSVFHRKTLKVAENERVIVTQDVLFPIGALEGNSTYYTAAFYIDGDSRKPHGEYPPVIKVTRTE